MKLPHTSSHPNRWITEREYAEIHGLCQQTLTTWRYRDRLAGRSEATSGFPQYRRWGRAVRYFLPGDAQNGGVTNREQ